MDYFKKIKVVTVSMSYEYDPLMFSEISVIGWPITKSMSEKNEDFMTLLLQ
jgi:hypothetical protein